MLLADGLKIKHAWDMIVTITAPGIYLNWRSFKYIAQENVDFKFQRRIFAELAVISGRATNNVYSLVNELDKSEKSLNSRVEVFFNELIK